MARRRRSPDAAEFIAASTPTPIYYLVIDGGFPRVAVSVREATSITGVGYRKILALIHAGKIATIGGGKGFIIPVSQLEEIRAWGELAEHQCEMRRLSGRRDDLRRDKHHRENSS